MEPRRHAFAWGVAAVLWGSAAILAQSSGGPPPAALPPETTTPPAEATQLSPAVVSARKSQLDTADLTADEKAQATKLYDQALEQLKLAEQRAAEAAQWKQLQKESPEKIERLESQLAKPPQPFTFRPPADATVADLDQLLTASRTKLSEAEAEVQQFQEEPARRADRRTAAVEEAETARQKIAQMDEALAAPPAPGAPPELVQAQKTLYEATRRANEQELEALTAELAAYDATPELPDLELRAAQREVAREQQAVQTIGDLVAKRRREEAAAQEQQARIAAARANPALRPLAEENVRLTQLRTGPDGLTAKIEAATEKLQQVKEEVDKVEGTQSELTEKLKLPGMAAYAGQLLLQVRSDLPRISDLQREIYLRNQDIASARFEMVDARRRKAQLDDVREEAAALVARLGLAANSQQGKETAAAAEELFTQQRQLLQDLQTDYTTYFNLLNDLNAQQQQLLNESRQLRSRVDENLMWVRASGAFGWGSLQASGEALRWLAEPANWRQVAGDAWTVLTNRMPLVFGPLLAFGVLLLLRRRMKQRLDALGELAAASYLVPFRTTLKALGLTVLLTLLWPTLALGLGWCLYSSLGAADFTRAVGVGLLVSGGIGVVLELTRRLLGQNGLAEAHFRWTNRRIRIVRRNLAWLAACVLPLVFVFGLVQWEGAPQRQESLGRLLFVVGMVLSAVFMRRILRPLPPLVEEAAPPQRTWTTRLVYRSAILLPLTVAALSLVGYHFTAWQLALRLFETACLVLGALVFQGLAVRWLRLMRGSLALQQARQRQEAREAAEAETRPTLETDAEIEREIDLQTVNAQTRQLLQVCVAVSVVTGLWLIWLDVIPGAQLLDEPLWSTTPSLGGATAPPEGAAAEAPASQPYVVTRADVLLATLVALVALLASRNIPGLVEVSLPQTAPLDAGARYALSTVVRYLLVAAGVIFASSIVGIQWSNVQWLVAALSVGVGFGLQELVANFISGLILLFERPVRVGDIVTIDGVTGTVTRVQIRATTIRNWDRQEYIVPNKDLITGRVLNWTLTSPINRIVVNVGVAYASAARQVRNLLLEILQEHKNVLSDPAPIVTFEQFGDSTLNFVARAYLANLDGRLDTISDLHTIIHERFAEAGIEIAFPQRDIYIRSLPHEDKENGKEYTEALGVRSTRSADGSQADDSTS